MKTSSSPLSRRGFLKTSSYALGAVALAGSTRPGYAAESNTIKVALVGCGGRGSGAVAQALSTKGPTKLWALADVFPEKVRGTLAQMKERFSAQVDVPPERQFVGLESYRQAIDSLEAGDVVLLATAPAFRPMHLEYAVAKGVHVFMEKSFAVDGPGIRRVLKAGEQAVAKNLKIAGGLMSRHYHPLEEAVQRIHDGAIGEVVTLWAYRMHGPVGFVPRPAGMSELAHQIANYSCYTWLNGSFLVDWLIHNIDVCCWVKGGWPVSAQGMGGRQLRTEPDQLFDHYFAEYTFEDGARLAAQGRHMNNCWGFFGSQILGTGGSAELGEGIAQPRLFKSRRLSADSLAWRYRGPECDAYQVEHDLLFDAIRNNKPHNEAERCAKGCLAAIMGRMACESGQRVTWEEALNSSLQLAPGLDAITDLNGPAPVRPAESGEYPVAMPGRTTAL